MFSSWEAFTHSHTHKYILVRKEWKISLTISSVKIMGKHKQEKKKKEKRSLNEQFHIYMSTRVKQACKLSLSVICVSVLLKANFPVTIYPNVITFVLCFLFFYFLFLLEGFNVYSGGLLDLHGKKKKFFSFSQTKMH